MEKCVWQRCHNEVVVILTINGSPQPHCCNHLVSRTQMMIHIFESMRTQLGFVIGDMDRNLPTARKRTNTVSVAG